MQTLLVSRRGLPSVLMWRDVRMSANSVALNMTVPSLLRGMFIDTSLCNHQHQQQCVYVLNASFMTARKSATPRNVFLLERYTKADKKARNRPCRQHGEGTVYRSRVAVKSCAAERQRRGVWCDLCSHRQSQLVVGQAWTLSPLKTQTASNSWVYSSLQNSSTENNNTSWKNKGSNNIATVVFVSVFSTPVFSVLCFHHPDSQRPILNMLQV